MKAYFGVCGIGLGHVGRCIPIAKELIRQHVKVLFSTYREGIHLVSQEGLPLVKAPSIGMRVKSDGTVDFRRTVINPGPFLGSLIVSRQIESEIKYMRSFKPDVVVSDSRVSPIIAARILDIPHICILNQFQIIIPRRTKFLRLASLVDYGALAIIGKIWTGGTTDLLIPDFPAPYTLSLGNLRIPRSYQKHVRFIGPILSVQPEDLKSKHDLRKELGLRRDIPFIFVSISGPTKERSYFTEILMRLMKQLTDNYQIVISLGYPNGSVEPAYHGNVTIYDWIPNRFEYLKACDLVVSRAGHGTITQAACYGKPMILIPTPSHTEQLNNSERASELGIAKVIQQDTLDKSVLLSAIEEAFDDCRFKRATTEIQRAVSELRGLKIAMETIKNLANLSSHFSK